jgi:hypothetical protein
MKTMPGNSSFLGNPTGFGTFVQGSYPNQMGTALPGDLANASERNFVDSLACLDPNGIYCGCAAFVLEGNIAERPGIGELAVVGANANSLARNFWGVPIRGQAGYADSNGIAFWPYQRMTPVARGQRGGSRVWVMCVDAVTDFDPVYVVIANAQAGNTRKIGSFTNSSALSTDAILLANAQFRGTFPAGSAACLVEFFGKSDESNVPAPATTTSTTTTTTTTTTHT